MFFPTITRESGRGATKVERRRGAVEAETVPVRHLAEQSQRIQAHDRHKPRRAARIGRSVARGHDGKPHRQPEGEAHDKNGAKPGRARERAQFLFDDGGERIAPEQRRQAVEPLGDEMRGTPGACAGDACAACGIVDGGFARIASGRTKRRDATRRRATRSQAIATGRSRRRPPPSRAAPRFGSSTLTRRIDRPPYPMDINSRGMTHSMVVSSTTTSRT